MPSAWVMSTMSGGCQSVMNPGWVSVCTADGRSWAALALIHSSLMSKSAPIRWSVLMAVTMRSWLQPADPHLAAGHEPGDEVAEGLEAVALQVGGGAGQRLDALDHEAAVGAQRDVGAHALEEQRQLDDLGLGGGVVDDRAALGEHRGQQHGLGGAHRRVRAA